MTDRKGRCLVCGEGLARAVVWCTSCATPHHRDCFAWAGHCALFGCQCTDYANDPRGRAVSALTMLDEDGRPMSQIEFLDYTSDREAALNPRTFYAIAGLLGWLSVATGTGALLAIGGAVAAAGTVAWWAGDNVSDYRIADRRHKILWNHREWQGKADVAMECQFDDIRALVVVTTRLTVHVSKHDSYEARRWTPHLELRDTRRIRLTDGEEVALEADDTGDCPTLVRERLEHLARFFRVPLEFE